MNVLKSPVLYIGLLIVALVLGALAAPYVVDWNSYRADLENYGRKLTGRDVAISGDIAVRLFPWPRLEAQGVRLANPPGFAAAPMATAENMVVHLTLAALTSGEVKVESIDLKKPQLNLIVDKAGNGNWHFNPQAPQGVFALLRDVQLGQINISDGRISFTDERHGFARSMAGVNGMASGAAVQGPWRLKAAAQLQDMPVDLSFSSYAYQAATPLKFAFRVTPQDGALPALAFDGEGQGGNYTGQINLDPVVTQDGRSSTLGLVKPLAFRAKVDVKGDRAKISAINITPADVKDSSTLIEGDGTLDFSSGARLALNFNAPRADLYGMVGSSSLRVWQTGGIMALVNSWMGQIPDALELTLRLKASTVQLAGHNLDNVALSAMVARGVLHIDDLTTDLPGHSRMKFSGLVFPGEGVAELGGNLAFESNDMRALAQWLWPDGKADIARIWNGQRGRLKAQSDVNWGFRHFSFQNVQYELDGLPGKGELDVTLGDHPALDLKAYAASLDFGSYVTGGLSDFVGVHNLLGLIPSQNSFQQRVDLAFDKLSVNGVEAQNVGLNFAASAAGLEFKSFNIGAVQGAAVTGNGLILMGPDGPSGDIKFAVRAARPQGLLQLMGLIPHQGSIPLWASGLVQTDVKANLNVKPGKAEPLVSYALSGTSGQVELVSSGTVTHLAAHDGAVIGFSGRLYAPDARDLLKLGGLSVVGSGGGEGNLLLTASGNRAQGYKSAVDFDGLGLQAGFSGTYVPRSDGLGLDGTFNLNADNGQSLLASLGWPLGGGAFSPFAAMIDVAAADDALLIKAARLQAGAQSLTATGRLLPGGVLDLGVAGGSFRLSDMLALAASPWAGPGSWPRATFQADWPFGLSGEIRLQPDALSDGLGEDLSEVAVNFSATHESRGLSLAAKRKDSQQVKLDASLKAKGATFTLAANVIYPFALEKVFTVPGKAAALAGKAMLQGTFTGEGRSAQGLLSNLAGSGTVALDHIQADGLAPDVFFRAIKDVKAQGEIQKAFAALTGGDGFALSGPQQLPFTLKDGLAAITTLKAETEEAVVLVTPQGDLPGAVFSARMNFQSRARSDLPPLVINFEGPAGAMAVRADAAALSAKLGTELINKDMMALAQLQQAVNKAAQDTAQQEQADKAKFEAYQAQRSELQLQQRMLKVFTKQRLLDAARLKAMGQDDKRR